MSFAHPPEDAFERPVYAQTYKPELDPVQGALARRIAQVRLGGRVERCHTIPHLGSYSNATHSWGVAALIYLLWPEEFATLGPVALFHDVPEALVGDVPSPMLNASSEVKEHFHRVEDLICAELRLPSEHVLGPQAYAKVKAADRLDLLLWCYDQERMGNTEASECRRELEIFLAASGLPHPADKLLAWIQANGYPRFKQQGEAARFIKELTK